MEIGKYIGLYLVKNGYCSLPGLGTLQLIKKPAKRSASGEMSAPSTEIQFSNVGSIDDQFPHFIGVRENISSNNASNAISTFSREVKETIQSNTPYVIDGIGRFVTKEGKVAFVPVSDFNTAEFDMTLPEVNDVPLDIDNTRVANNNNSSQNKDISFSNLGGTAVGERSVNYGRLFAALGTLALLAIGIYFGWDYLKKNQEAAKLEAATTDTASAVTTTADTSANIDSTAAALAGQQATAAATPTVAPMDTTKPATANSVTTSDTSKKFVGPAMKVAVRTYTNQASADAFSKKLANYVAKSGRTTSVAKIDSTNYQVVISLPSTDKPADAVINEIRANYNPGEKFGKVTAVK